MPKQTRARVVTRIFLAIVVSSAIAVSALALADVRNVSGEAAGSTGDTEPSTAGGAASGPENAAISIAVTQRHVPVRDGELDDGERYCDPNDLYVTWSRPPGVYTYGAYIDPLGPAPGADTTAVNGVVVCDGSTYAYMGFEALRTADGWEIIPVPDIGGGDAEHTSEPEPPGDQVVPTLVPRTTPPASVPSGKLPSAAKALTASIESYAGYDAQATCSPGAKPGVLAFRALMLKTYPNTRSLGITRNCSAGGRSEHKEGRAFDWGVNGNNPAQRATAKRVLDWLFATDEFGNRHAMARRLGIMYVVWDRKIWGAYRSSEGWRAYNGANPHTDHIHFSFAWPGAKGVTSFWTGVPAAMPGGNDGRRGGGHVVRDVRTRGDRDVRTRGDRGTIDWTRRTSDRNRDGERRYGRGYWTWDRQNGWTWHEGPRPSPFPSVTWSPSPRPERTYDGTRRERDRDRYERDRDRYRRDRDRYERDRDRYRRDRDRRRGTPTPSPSSSPTTQASSLPSPTPDPAPSSA